MNIIFSKQEKQKICEEILHLQQTTSLKQRAIIEAVGKKYNILPSRIYGWNKQLGNIFEYKLFTINDKIKILKEVLHLLTENKNILLQDAVLKIANKHNITSDRIYGWNRKYKVFKTKQKYSNEEIILILNKIKKQANGENPRDIARKFAKELDVSINTIYFWNRKFNIFKTRKTYSDEDAVLILNEINKRIGDKDINTIVLEFADILKIQAKTIYIWNQNFNIFPRSKRKTYSEEFKKKVLNEFITIGFTRHNIKIIANKYNISENTIYAWNRKYKIIDTKSYYEQKKQEVIEKLKADKIFKDNLLNSIKQKSKQ